MQDPIELTAQLVRCPSITPREAGALQLLETLLKTAGFECTRIDRNGTPNLFARWGRNGNGRSFGFNGHTDVVPVGDEKAWNVDPFGAEIKDGWLYGRGSVDMKSGVAAFVAAAIDFVEKTPPEGSIVIAITGDEEGNATDGTTALLDWMKDNDERLDHCIVGEPTCPNHMGEMMKIGRRGSMTGYFTVTGVQGHSAYPHRANNPLPAMAKLVDRLASTALDSGSDHFDASTLAVTTIDTGNDANNVIPAQANCTVNIRFNDLHSAQSLTTWLQDEAAKVASEFAVDVALQTQVSGESFVTPPGELSQLVSEAVQAETGITPELSTSGGTSDARFVKDVCPVVEFGLVGKRMHGVDERASIDEIHQLKAIYGRILTQYFSGADV